MSKSIILGIHDGHNASACLIKNDVVIAALSEERLTNKKNQSGFPQHAIKKILEFTEIKPEEVTQIAISSLVRMGDPLAPNNFGLKILEALSPYLASHQFAKFYVNFFHLFRNKSEIRSNLGRLNISAPIKFVEHHLAHAASAYFQRPWLEKSLILTLDGAGDGLSATVNIGENNQIKRISSTIYYHSPSNNLYSEVTGYLGMKRWEHEYKLMGLAPYGKTEFLINKLRKIIRINPESPLEFQNLSGSYARGIQPQLKKIFYEQRFDNIAAATQLHFEELVITWVKNAIKKTGIKKVVFSGGSFLNVKANQLIRELPEIEESFFYPACDDVGTSIGAALFANYHKRQSSYKPINFVDLYQGIEYKDPDILYVIKKYRLTLKTSRPKNLEKTVAKLLSQRKIVARFSGRDEFGPRALGNRSILADPRNMEAIRKINFAIKMRDFWMPFAPAILEKDINKYLIKPRQSRYMIESFNTLPKASEIIAGLHPFDLSCRPQTVINYNPKYFDILIEFKKLTGISGILNTSFNLHGFPIVGTPEVAIKTFLNSGLDYLAIGSFLIKR